MAQTIAFLAWTGGRFFNRGRQISNIQSPQIYKEDAPRKPKMSHYHLPYRGLPQEILEQIFEYSLSLPDGITIIPKSYPPLEVQQRSETDRLLALPPSVKPYEKEIYNGGSCDGGPLRIKFNRTEDRTDTYALIRLNRIQYPIARRIFWQNNVIYMPIYYEKHWTEPLVRLLPPVKHISFLNQFDLSSKKVYRAACLIIDTICAGTELESITIEVYPIDDSLVHKNLRSLFSAVQDGKINKLRLITSNLPHGGLRLVEFYDLYKCARQLLPHDQQTQFKKVLKEFRQIIQEEDEDSPEWHHFCDSHQNVIQIIFLQSGWNFYVDECRPGEYNTVVALRPTDITGKRRRVQPQNGPSVEDPPPPSTEPDRTGEPAPTDEPDRTGEPDPTDELDWDDDDEDWSDESE